MNCSETRAGPAKTDPVLPKLAECGSRTQRTHKPAKMAADRPGSRDEAGRRGHRCAEQSFGEQAYGGRRSGVLSDCTEHLSGLADRKGLHKRVA